MSDSVQPHRRQPTRIPCPWGSPGKNTGVGSHFLLQCMKVKSESEVPQSCWTPSDPRDCSLPGSSVYGILQARVLEWGAIALSRRSHTDACKHGVRVGKRGSPKENPGGVAWRNKKGKRVEGRAGTNNSPLQAPLPHPTPASCAGAQGRASCPLPFSPAREAPGGSTWYLWAQLTEVSFPPRKPPHHNLCLCLHRTFLLLIYMETPER